MTLLSLEQDQGFRFSADDLSDYYYTYRVSPARALRNSFRCEFDPAELADFEAAKGLDMQGPQLLSLNTMAMGDCLSVEVGQAADLQVLRQHAGASVPSETLLYRHAVPNTPSVELLAIDDHVVLQKLLLQDIPRAPPLRDTQIFKASEVAYDRVGLVLNDDKKRRNLTRGIILGAELDGEKGLVGPPRQKTLSLALLTCFLAKRGHATRELLDRVLGCWVHALMFRRPVFAVVDHLFREGLGLPRNVSFRMSEQPRNELLMLACLSPTLLTDLKVQYDDQLYCLDASPSGGAVCSTVIGPQASAEVWRHGELRGYHTRLQSEVSALLSEKGIPHAGEDLFGAHGSLPPDLQPFPKLDPFVPRPISENILFDVVVISSKDCPWAKAFEFAGFRVFRPLTDTRADDGSPRALTVSLVRELVALASRRVVKEWHCSEDWPSFGPLGAHRLQRRGRLSSGSASPEGVISEETAASRCFLLLQSGAVSGFLLSSRVATNFSG